jgi:hypothetical protein
MSCSSESLISSLFLPKIIALQIASQQRASTVQATKSTGTHEAEIIAFHPIDVNRSAVWVGPLLFASEAVVRPSFSHKKPFASSQQDGIFCKYLLLAAIACEGMARLQ